MRSFIEYMCIMLKKLKKIQNNVQKRSDKVQIVVGIVS